MALDWSSYRAVLFDVDGTIAETEGEGHLPAFNQVFAEFGVSWRWSTDDYKALLTITGGAERMLAYGRQMSDPLVQSESGRATILQMHQRKNAIYAQRLESGLLRPRPGFVDLVRQIVAENRRWAVVTTTSRANWDSLWRFAIQPIADIPAPSVIICGEDVSQKKPNPEAYELALEQLGLASCHAIAIEDSPNGLIAARAAGIDTVIVRSQFFADADVTGATCVVSELSDLNRGLFFASSR